MTLSPPKKDLKNRVYNYKYELLDLSIRAIQLLDSSYYFYDRFAQLFPSPSVNVVQLQRGGFIFSFFWGREITRHAFSFGNIDDNHWTAAHSCCVLCRSYRAAMRRMNHSLWSWHLKVAVHTTLHCTIIFVSFFLNIVPPEDVLNTHQESHNQHVVLAFAAPLYIYTYLACTYAKAHKLFCIYIYMLSCSNLIFLLLSLFPLPLGFLLQLAFQVLNFLMIIFSALMIWKGLMCYTGSESPIVVVLSGSMEPAFYRGDLWVTTLTHNSIPKTHLERALLERTFSFARRAGACLQWTAVQRTWYLCSQFVCKLAGSVGNVHRAPFASPCMCRVPAHTIHTLTLLYGSNPCIQNGDVGGSYKKRLFLTNDVSDPIRVGEILVFKVTGRDIPIVHRVMKLHQETGTGAIKFLTKGDNNFVDDRGLYAPGQMWLQPSDVVGRARAFIPHIGIVTILMNDYPAAKYALLGVLGLFVLLHRE